MSEKIKIVFFGTPDYVLPITESLYKTFKLPNKEYGLIAVVTQPPKPAGRGNKLEYSAVDEWAHKHNIQIVFDLDKIPEADLGVVASFGKIIPKSVIDKFKFGILNIHPSELPKYRGSSPIQKQFLNNEKQTAITVIKMDEKMDHGQIVSQTKVNISENENAEELRNRLFYQSADIVSDLIPSFIKGKIKLREQNHEEATFTKMITKQDGFVESILITKDPERLLSLLKAMYPWPGVWTLVDGKRLKIISAHKENEKLIIDRVQLEGKNEVEWNQFRSAYPQIAKALS